METISKQVEIETFLTDLGFTPTDEYEESGVLFTKYETLGLGIIVERNMSHKSL